MDQACSNDEKTRGRNSRSTVPLKKKMKTTILNYISTSLDNGHFLCEGFSGTVLRGTLGRSIFTYSMVPLSPVQLVVSQTFDSI